VNSPVLEFGKKKVGQRQVFPFLMADGRQGEKLTGRMTFWVYRLAKSDRFAVDINGRAVPASRVRRLASGERRGGLTRQPFEIDLADCPPFRGENELGLTLKSKIADRTPYMEELELVVGSKSGKAKTSQRRGAKIYLAVDSEGPTGVAEYWARNLKSGDPKLPRYRRLMTDDVNAAVRGCFAAGAAEVYVKDDGFRDKNLLVERLDKRAKLITGGSRLLYGLDSSFDGVMLIGFHAMEGAEDGVLAHTWSSARRRRYWFNGREGGEVAAYAIVAGHDHGVPIIMASGCSGLGREARAWLGQDTVTVAVKRKRQDGSVELFEPNSTQKASAEGASKAVRQIARYRPFSSRFPLKIRLQLKDKQVTEGYIKWRRESKPDWPGKRAGANTLEATLRSTKHIVLGP